eukprot:Pgem_evm1s16034
MIHKMSQRLQKKFLFLKSLNELIIQWALGSIDRQRLDRKAGPQGVFWVLFSCSVWLLVSSGGSKYPRAEF